MFGSTNNNEYFVAGVHLKNHGSRREIPDCKYCMKEWVSELSDRISELYKSLLDLIVKFNETKKVK